MITPIEIWTIGTSIVTIASIIVKVTPTQKDDAIFAKIMKCIEFLSVANKIPVNKKK